MILDTSFLIDLQREWAGGNEGPAIGFLRARDQGEFGISTISAVEFLEGYTAIREGERFLEPFVWFDVTQNVARAARRIRRTLRSKGRLIGDFDILIAATAVVLEAYLVTADIGHFELVEGLLLEPYR